ncbi:MAG: carbamoyl phosphate synthase small subunit [Lachnospiraceae bacterium]|jgi:carbamoyl-phosphate synthase small subunit|nr:carbamoyl phosphate synthase small subunit [Lachnospiraceae bacterium]
MKAFLILEDGTKFQGESIGSTRDCISEIVFNTSMTGYLEVLTDPSYAGQAVVMTYPLIGNYGVTPDMESSRSFVDGYIVRELSDIPSNFRMTGTLEDFLKDQDIPGIQGIDTRALTKILREKGTMNGMITTKTDYDIDDVIKKLHEYKVGDVVSKVTTKEIIDKPAYLDIEISNLKNRYEEKLRHTEDFHFRDTSDTGVSTKDEEVKGLKVLEETESFNVALMDFGAKKNIIENLRKRRCNVRVFPSNTPAEEVIDYKPDGIMLSNGPGDPADCIDIIKEIKKLYNTNIPIFAICLGHQLMALANGAKTYKLKYGHRGGNHPVKDLSNGRVYISSQNHGYAVDASSLDKDIATEAFINVNDKTNEGFSYNGKNIFTVQYHPEASPGPQDSAYLFDRFIEMMKGEKNA